MRLEEACRVLSNWDRRDDLSSVGAQVFREFIREVTPRGAEDPTDATSLWRKPFDPVHPLHTPSGLSDPSAALLALDRAVTRLREAEIPLDAPLGKIQFVVRNGERIPIYGGLAFSNVKLKLVPRVGYTDPAASSNSYIQIVSFDEHGPIADAILVNSQSSNPGSPFYSDQTWMYSRKQWVRLPFESGDIDAQAIERSTLRVTLPKSSH